MSKLTLAKWLERDPETRRFTVQAGRCHPPQGHLLFKHKDQRYAVGFVLSDDFAADVERAICAAEELIEKIDAPVEVPMDKNQ